MGANLGVLASLMQTMTPQMPQYNPQEVALAQQRIQSGRTGNETALLTLQDLKQKQAAEEQMLLAIQNDPSLRERLFGGSTIASLPTAGGPSAGPPGGALTQQTFGGAGAPGVAQAVPGGQDLSRDAGVSPQGGGPIPPDVMGQSMPTVTPPAGGMPTLATLGGPQQGPQQGPQNPLLEMARRDPRAAMMLQQQLQQRQEQQWKMQTTQLTMREKTAEAFASKLQGVNSQESYESAVQDLMQWAPQQASRLPKVWSKEAMQPIIEAALSAKDKATLGIQDIQAQADALKAQAAAATAGLAQRKAAETIPNYTGDAKVDARIYSKMQKAGLPLGTRPPQPIVDEALLEQEGSSTRVAESTGAAAEARKPLGDTQLLRFNTLTQAEDTIKKLTTEFTPEERARFVGMGGMTMGAQQLQQLYADATGGKADPKFARFAALVALAKAEAFSTAGKALTETESGVVYGYIPTGKEYSAEEFEQKLKLAQERVPSMLDRELKLATTPRSELPGMRQRGELGASTSQGQPQGQAPAAAGPSAGKPVGQMSTADLLAEKAAILARGGK